MIIVIGGCKKDSLYSSDEYWDYLNDQFNYWEGYVDGVIEKNGEEWKVEN